MDLHLISFGGPSALDAWKAGVAWRPPGKTIIDFRGVRFEPATPLAPSRVAGAYVTDAELAALARPMPAHAAGALMTLASIGDRESHMEAAAGDSREALAGEEDDPQVARARAGAEEDHTKREALERAAVEHREARASARQRHRG
jgi:hypothetical protein